MDILAKPNGSLYNNNGDHFLTYPRTTIGAYGTKDAD
jgi:hypothetical protein